MTDHDNFNLSMNPIITPMKTYEEQRRERLTDSVYEYIDEQQDGKYVGDELLVRDLRKILEELKEDYVDRLMSTENMLKRLQ